MIKLLDRRIYQTGQYKADEIEVDGVRLKRVTRIIGKPYTDYEPVDSPPAGHVGWMFDGTALDFADSRQLYKVRDRAETNEEYESLSR